MNLIERIEDNVMVSDNEGRTREVETLKNYLSQNALSRGWTLDEFCSWLEDNYGEQETLNDTKEESKM